MFHHCSLALLLLGLYVAVIAAVPLEGSRKARASCPPGYWCQKKRDTDSSTCPSDFRCSPAENKRDEVSTKSCPPGYWCRKRRNVILDETDAGSCPPGYWCSKKKRSAAQSQCPPGYWCRKRSLEDEGKQCPPGYWCSKRKRRSPFMVPNNNAPCPGGFFCRRSEMVIDRETDEEDCPSYFWCKKSAMPNFGPAMPNSAARYFQCPPGYWCSRKKRSLADDSCPPGYWCRRDQAQNEENTPCPSHLWCKSDSNVIHQETSKNDCPENHWCRKRRHVDFDI